LEHGLKVIDTRLSFHRQDRGSTPESMTMKTSALIGVIALFVVAVIGTAGASPLPCDFFGKVTIDGAPAPVGTYITAWVANQECGSQVTGSVGSYGQLPGTLNPSFTVFCPDIQDNERVNFFVNGYKAEGSRNFRSDGLINLDLSLDRSIHIPPEVNFSSNVTTGNAPLAVQFTDITEAFPRSWVWDFGDESGPSFMENPVHIFDTPGVYDVGHTAVNGTGIGRVEKPRYIVVYPPGDFNHNWNVDDDDVLALRNMSEGVLTPDMDGDLNHDGVINDSDISRIIYYRDRE
jgi:PKD repeat protein